METQTQHNINKISQSLWVNFCHNMTHKKKKKKKNFYTTYDTNKTPTILVHNILIFGPIANLWRSQQESS